MQSFGRDRYLHMARLDTELFKRGLVQSRSRAQELISKSNVRVNGAVCTKASYNINEQDVLTAEDTIGFVSRGGTKLAFALEQFHVDCKGKTALDVGASTGGFTQCLLQRGAACVWAVDVGRGQMVPALAEDPRVKLYEGVNARTLSPAFFGGLADLAVMDVSFISQTLLYEAVFSCVKAEGNIVVLIKPQFEAGQNHLDKNGVVRDLKAHQEVLEKINTQAEAHGRQLAALIQSPIKGGDGNTEYLGLLSADETPFKAFSAVIHPEN